MMYQFGSDDFELGDDCTYSTDEATTTAALQYFADINDDDVMPRSVWVSGDDPNALFKSGQVAAYYSGSWQVADFQANITDFEWASALMPAQPRRATNLGGGYVVVYKGDKSKAALDFVNWLFTAENYTEICEISGFLPVIQGLDIDYGAAQTQLRPVQRGDRRLRPGVERPGARRPGDDVRRPERGRRRRPAQGRGRQARQRRTGRGHDHVANIIAGLNENIDLRVTLDGHRHPIPAPRRAAQAARPGPPHPVPARAARPHRRQHRPVPRVLPLARRASA